MLEDTELLGLMNDLESDRVERTTACQNTDKLAQAICAFSNDFPNHGKPGYLLIGVDDHGQAVNLKVTDQLLQNLSAIRSDGNILPFPALIVQKYGVPGTDSEIAVVEVLPSDVPPVRYKGCVWIRVGPRRAIATEMEERRLSERRTAASRTFDSRPCVGSSLKDLDCGLFLQSYLPYAVSPKVLEENNREIELQLASLRFYDPGKDCPTYAGILLFGHDPMAWLPGAFIQFVRLDGVNLADPVQIQRQFSGNLLATLQQMDDFIALQIRSWPEAQSPLREIIRADYPKEALREILMNAVMHRWYDNSTAPIRFYWFSDRIEIHSPGGLYGEATPDNFPRQVAYRNPVLAEAMKVLGYVNRFGRGVIRAQEVLKRNGNPEAEFTFESTAVLAILRRPS